MFAKALAQTNNEELDENKASIIIWEGEKKVSWHSEDFSSLDFTPEMFVKEKLLADDGKYVPEVNDKVTARVMKKFCNTIRDNISYQNRKG